MFMQIVIILEWRDDEVEADESGNELDEEDLSEEDEVAEGNKVGWVFLMNLMTQIKRCCPSW